MESSSSLGTTPGNKAVDMVSEASSDKKRRRASKPKSKGGCVNCKQSRVKCDETKDQCLRCKKRRIKCSYKTVPLPVCPKASPRTLLQRPIAPSYRIPPFPGPEFPTETQVEKRYIQFFLDKSTSGFQGMVDWTLWNRVMLQSSHQEPFVRNFVIAIAALIKSFERPNPQQKSSAVQLHNAKSLATLHREYALARYGKAVKIFQSQVASAEPKQLLYSCLLIFFFETLLDNRQTALPHILEGIRLLRSQITQPTSLGRKSSSRTSILGLEDELVEAFDHLDLQVCSVYDVRPLNYHQSVLAEPEGTVEEMPPLFDDLTEARKYLNIIMARVHHFLATTWSITDSSLLTKDFSMSFTGMAVATGANIFSTPHKTPTNLATQQQIYVEELNRWSRAFAPVLEQCRSPALIESRDFLKATKMRIHAIGTEIVLAGVLFTSEISYDRFFPEFRELLRLADIIVDAYERRETRAGPEDMIFSMDLGLTPQLFLLLLRCRDSGMRRRVIKILGSWYSEVCWNPRLIAQIGIFIMETEGESSAENPIPESCRAILSRICEGTPQGGRNQCLMQVVQKCGGLDGGPVWKEKLVSYITNRKTFTGEDLE